MNEKHFKHWLKENWFKVVMCCLVLLFGLSVFYYFIYISVRENTIQNQKNLTTCNKAGIDFYEKYQSKNIIYGYKFGEPIYHFNKQLNTCLVLIIYKSSTHSSFNGRELISVYDIDHGEINDVYSNKKLVSTDSLSNDAEFYRQRDILMNN